METTRIFRVGNGVILEGLNVVVVEGEDKVKAGGYAVAYSDLQSGCRRVTELMAFYYDDFSKLTHFMGHAFDWLQFHVHQPCRTPMGLAVQMTRDNPQFKLDRDLTVILFGYNDGDIVR